MGSEIPFLEAHRQLLEQTRKIERAHQEINDKVDREMMRAGAIDIPPEDVVDITDQRRLEHKP